VCETGFCRMEVGRIGRIGRIGGIGRIGRVARKPIHLSLDLTRLHSRVDPERPWDIITTT
jgi:hypothetical protein